FRIDPEEAAALSEVAEGTRRVALAGPVRTLSVAQLEAEPPVVGIHPAEAGEDADETREGNGCRLSQGLRGDRARSQQLAADREQIVERATYPGGRRSVERSGQAERLEHSLSQVLGERHLRPLGDHVCEHFEAGVRIDP